MVKQEIIECREFKRNVISKHDEKIVIINLKKLRNAISKHDEKIAIINLKKLIERRYKPTITNQIRWFFESAMEVIIIISAHIIKWKKK